MSKPEGKRACALAAVRHPGSSPLISTQHRRNPMSKARRIQATHGVTDCISQVPPEIQKSRKQERLHETVPKHRETDCSPGGKNRMT